MYNHSMLRNEKTRRVLPLALNSFAHLLMDALCASALFGTMRSEAGYISLVFIYNTLAFSTQCFVGLAADRIKKHSLFACLAELAAVLGFFLPAPSALRVLLIGIGNSVFHVACGAMTLENSENRASPLGIFVAPGAVGITLGTLFPSFGWLFASALIPIALLRLVILRRLEPFAPAESPKEVSKPAGVRNGTLPAVLLLTAAVAVRAIGGSAVRFEWQTGGLAALLLTLFVFAGKAIGGFVCDRLGAKASALLSIPAAAVLIAFLSEFAAPSLIGQFALNLTMPITLYLMYRVMPDSPAFAFGLAASALWPGTTIGKLFTLTGSGLRMLVLISFLFGLAAILYSERRIRALDNASIPANFERR